MRVLLATGIYPPESGGPATYTKGLFEALRARGHSVQVIAYGETGRNDGVTRISRKGGPAIRYLRYVWKAFFLARRSDILYAQGPVSEGLPATIAAKLAGVPIYIKVVGDYAWEMASQKLNVKTQKFGLDEFLKTRHRGLIGLYERIERWTAKRARRVIVPSRYLKTVVEKWGVPSERVQVILNANEPLPETRERETERQAFDVAEKVVILTAVRAVPWKGVSELISWWKELPASHHLVVAGDGPELERWKTLAHELGVGDRVRFLGRINRQELARWYDAADAFVLNSGYEGYPHVVAEAASRGLPCIVSDQGGNPETRETFDDLVTVLPYLDESSWVNSLTRQSIRPTTYHLQPTPYSHDHMIDATEKVLSGIDHPMQTVMVSYDRDLLDPSSAAHARVASLSDGNHAVNIIVMQGRVFRNIVRGIRFARRLPGRTVITAQDPFAAGVVGYCISRWTNAPLEIQEHGDFFSGYWTRESWRNRLLSCVGRFILKRAERVRVVSERVKDHLIRIGVPADRIDVIPVAMYLSGLLSLPMRPFPEIPLLVAPCRFVPQKGLSTLLRAAAILHSRGIRFSLELIGSGPLDGSLRAFMEANKLTEVVRILPWENPHDIWSRADLFVLSSNYEGFGRTIAEAMAAGVPVVTTDVGCVGSLFRPHIDGRVVQPGDAVGLAAAIEEHVRETDRRDWMRTQARERARSFPSQAAFHNKQRQGWKNLLQPTTYNLQPRFDLWVGAFVLFSIASRAASAILFHKSLMNREWGIYKLVIHWFEGFGYSYARELGCASAYRSPGYLFFLTGLYSIFRPENTLAQAIVQNIFVVLTLWLTYLVGARLVGKRAGLVAGFLMAAYPYTFYHYTQYYHTFLSSFFLLLIVWFVLRLAESKRWRNAIGAGLSIGALAYVQGTILIATPFIVAWLLWKWWPDWKRTLIAAVIMAVCSAGLIAPWTYRNWTELHTFVPLTTDLGFGLFKANSENIYELTKRGYPQEVVDFDETSSTNPFYWRARLRPEIEDELKRDGVFRESKFWTEWHALEPAFETNTCAELGPNTEVEQNRYWTDKATSWITEHWFEQGWKLQLLKIKTFWQPALFPSVKTGAPWSFADNPIKVWLARNAMTVASSIVIFGGWIGIAFALRRRDKNVWLSLIVIGAYTLLHSFFAGYTKYRIPLDHLMAAYAGWTIVALWDSLRHKRRL
ncbi:glycosyltransferase [Candidatus Uhrbacteria bacterium]|nr:glycosyltransferase [Candidatus Uhrbacteria bacterium]